MNYHFIKQSISHWTQNLKKILGTKNLVDMFSKAIMLQKLNLCKASIGFQILGKIVGKKEGL